MSIYKTTRLLQICPHNPAFLVFLTIFVLNPEIIRLVKRDDNYSRLEPELIHTVVSRNRWWWQWYWRKKVDFSLTDNIQWPQCWHVSTDRFVLPTWLLVVITRCILLVRKKSSLRPFVNYRPRRTGFKGLNVLTKNKETIFKWIVPSTVRWFHSIDYGSTLPYTRRLNSRYTRSTSSDDWRRWVGKVKRGVQLRKLETCRFFYPKNMVRRTWLNSGSYLILFSYFSIILVLIFERSVERSKSYLVVW